jgi:hypothetical protein
MSASGAVVAEVVERCEFGARCGLEAAEQPEVGFDSDLRQGGDVAVEIRQHKRSRPLYDVVH